MPQSGRSAINVLLDAVIALPDDGAGGEPINLALQRLADVDGAYEVTVNDDGSTLDVAVDLSNLVGGTLIALTWLVAQVADSHGVSREEVVSDLRAWLAA